MHNSLFIERHAEGLAFYINGDLQFDTADEAWYHEYLVVPALALAAKRFPTDKLRVLICGGGDGLAAREVWRFSQVERVDLVDYNPEVIELGKTVFKQFNQGSLWHHNLTIYGQEAEEFVSSLPSHTYHVVICDFTYPTCIQDTKIYSKEWFEQLQRVLHQGGTISTNGVSPEKRTAGFWCLYQTLLAANLAAKPLHLLIPSFQQHGYGNWGFFLASNLPISKQEIETLVLPTELQVLTIEALCQGFIFPQKIACLRERVAVHTLDCPQLFYYLLNPQTIPKIAGKKLASAAKIIDFLEVQEAENSLPVAGNLLNLETTVQRWLESQDPEAAATNLDFAQLIPIQHRYHHPQMAADWLENLKKMLGEIDFSDLLSSILQRARELPPKVVVELQELQQNLRSGNLPTKPSPTTVQLIIILSVTLLMANMVAPDAAFAKGYYHSGGSGGYSDGYSESGSDLKGLGFGLVAGGIWWLFSSLYKNYND